MCRAGHHDDRFLLKLPDRNSDQESGNSDLYQALSLTILAKNRCEFLHEIIDILKLAVDGGKTNEGDVVDSSQRFHHLLSDLA